MYFKEFLPNDCAAIRSKAGEISLRNYQDAKSQRPLPRDTFFTLLQRMCEEALASS